MSVSAGVSDAAIAVREKLQGRISQTRVKRYWPGKAPEWAEDADEGGGAALFGDGAREREDLVQRVRASAEDARLRRLGESRREREEAVARHREIRAAEIVSSKAEEAEEERRQQAREEADAEDEEDEDAIEARRRAIRERLLQRQREEELQREGEEEAEEEEEEEDEESEYETDSEDEEGGLAMIKPVFVPKSERETVAEREKQEAAERELEEAVKQRLAVRKVETKALVVEEIRKEEERERQGALGEGEADAHDVDTDDEVNEAEEFEGWRQREIARIRREREERDALVREKEEREMLARMTDEERREWERKNPKSAPAKAPKTKWNFMQKYYHKGAFFQAGADDRGGTVGDDQIYTRDFSAPTGEDKLDKSILPKVMQVKHFGRSGRSKWTHLVEEDTTQWDTPWSSNDPLRAKYNNKMAGMNQPLAKPKGSKKLQDWETR